MSDYYDRQQGVSQWNTGGTGVERLAVKASGLVVTATFAYYPDQDRLSEHLYAVAGGRCAW